MSDYKLKKSASIAIGSKYGRWTIIAPNNKLGKHKAYLVQCDCGIKKTVVGYSLRNGDSKSCGCWNKEQCKLNGLSTTSVNPAISSARTVWNSHYKQNGDTISFADFYKLSQNPCFYCGGPPSNSSNRYKYRKSLYEHGIKNGTFYYNGLDRVDSSKTHTLENVVTCCKYCNQAKMSMTSQEFQNWLKQTSAHYLYKITPEKLDRAVLEWENKNIIQHNV